MAFSGVVRMVLFVGGAAMLMGWPLVLGAHLVLMRRDHRVHQSIAVTLLALPWLPLAYAIAMSVEANLGPPQFGIPIAALLIGTWARNDRGFRVGLGLFLIPSAYLIISGAVEGLALHPIPILLGGPGTVLMLSIWKHQRGRALEMLTASAGAAYLSANGSASS